MARLGRKTTKNVPQNWRRRSYFLFFGASLSSCAAEWIGIAKSSLVAFERILSSFAAKPIRNATLCLVAFEHIPSSSAAKPIRIANLTLLPRDVCGYARANVAPLTRNQRCHTQKLVLLPCCLSWWVAALQSAEASPLWCLGVPGVAPRVLYTAAGCTHVFALLVAVQVQPRMLAAEQHGHPCTFWNVPLACAATRAHFWGCPSLRTLHVLRWLRRGLQNWALLHHNNRNILNQCPTTWTMIQSLDL